MSVVIEESKLRKIIKEEVKDIFEKEMLKFRLMLVPEISNNEQEDIEEIHGAPTNEIVKTILLEDL